MPLRRWHRRPSDGASVGASRRRGHGCQRAASSPLSYLTTCLSTVIDVSQRWKPFRYWHLTMTWKRKVLCSGDTKAHVAAGSKAVMIKISPLPENLGIFVTKSHVLVHSGALLYSSYVIPHLVRKSVVCFSSFGERRGNEIFHARVSDP